MRRLAQLLVTALSAAIIGVAVDASQLYKQGREAEKAGKFDKAYILYSQAAALDPASQMYWLRSQAVRTRAALAAIPAGGSLPAQFSEDAGDLLPEPLPKLETPTAKEMEEARKPQSPTELKAKPSRMDFNLTGDARSLFEKVAQAFGLDCVFDSEYQPARSIRFRIDSVDYREALRGVELATNSFIVPLTSKLFLVANDTQQKRREVEPWISVALQVPEATSQQELTQVVTAVQQTLAIERVGFDSKSDTVFLRGPASKIVPAEAMFNELIRQRSQVVLDVDFLEVDHNNMLSYGVSLPNLFQAQPMTSVSNVLTTLADLARWGPGGTLFTLGVADAQVLAQLNNVASQSLTHVELRSVDGQPVTFHAGDRYPILTAGYFGEANVNAGTVPINSGAPTNFPTTNGTPVNGVPTNGVPSTNPTGSLLNTPSTFGNVSNPTATATADFNGDGILDFAATASSANQVVIFPGIGSGNFGNPVTFATGANPSALLAVDLNRDGALDLVTANASDNSVSVLLGAGDGTFKNATTLGAGTTPAALVSADFNRDGYLDLAIVNSGSNNVTILLGNGDGTFQAGQTFAVGTSPRALATADFNGDGLPDLAVADYGSNDLWILLGNGDGTFQQKATYATGSAPRGLAADDFNHDSLQDLVVANSSSNTVSVFLGNGDGTFGGGQQFYVGSGPVAVVTTDFNRDVLEDIAVVNQGDGTASMLLGLGNGSFQTAISFAIGTGYQPDALSAADLNSDGYPDLLVANFAANNFSELIGSPYGGFQDSNGNPYQYSGGQTYAPPPAFTYEDLGLEVKATPHVHSTGNIGLELEAEIKLLTGNALNGVPEIAQRKLQSQVQLRNGEGVIIAGLVSLNDARSILGIPGLSSLRGLGRLLQQNTHNKTTSEVLIIVRPRLIGLPPGEFVSHEIWIGSESHPVTPM